MSKIIQYDLFEARPTEVDELRIELEQVRESNNKVRKAMFARHGELAKLYINAIERLEILERNICQKK